MQVKKGSYQNNRQAGINSLMEEFSRVSRDKITELKALDKPVMGWSSVYTPEEIIYAAGIIPFRITGEKAPASAKSRALLYSNLCPYVLSCMEEGVQNVYDFLSGIVIVNTCDARRRLYDAWRKFVKTPYIYIIDLPKLMTPESKAYFKKQFILFAKSIEDHFGIKIDEKALREAILLYNKTRSLLSRLYNLRKRKNPPITGVEALSIIKAGMAIDRKDFNKKLTLLLEKLGSHADTDKAGTIQKRILLTGSYFDHLELLDLIEQLNVNVVCEDISNGIKYFDGNVDTNREPFEALADYYLEKAPCARMPNSEERFKSIQKLVREYEADAVVYFSLKFCDSNLIDYPYQKKRLNENGIPVLFLEGERSLINLHQLRTRIQAFLEMNGVL